MTTAPIEIAARTAIAIRIGTSGEEPPLSCEDAGSAPLWVDALRFSEPFPEPFAGLPC